MQRKDLFMALIEEIVIEEGYNKRETLEDIPELADSIVENGVINAVRAYQKVGDINRLTLLSGHRRIAAVKLAISDGRLNPKEFRIPVIKVSKMSDIDRILDLETSNSQMPLSVLERANIYKTAKAYGATPEDIAKKVGKSVTTINNLLLLATAGEPTKKLIREGTVAHTTVEGLLRKKEPSVVDKELADAVKEKKAAVQENVSTKIKDEVFVLGASTEFKRDEENTDIPTHQDNTKVAGISGMDAQLSDSSKPIKITKKNLEKEVKAATYTKEFILKLLTDNDVSEDEAAYVILNQELK